jgi:anaerobic ribonucleoside-triphosphate reductase activating protein
MPSYWERKLRLLGKSDNQLAATEGQEIQLASLIEESIVDGPGLRFVLFTQGCPHRCPGCHNPQTHLGVGGTYFSQQQILSIYDEHPACRGTTFSGGEPFLHGAPLARLATKIHQRGGDVITYTGYRLERLKELAKTDEGTMALLKETDLLIDGPFILKKRCLEAAFVGSTNQRLIALSPLGNKLLKDIPVLPEGPRVERLIYE